MVFINYIRYYFVEVIYIKSKQRLKLWTYYLGAKINLEQNIHMFCLKTGQVRIGLLYHSIPSACFIFCYRVEAISKIVI